MPIACVQRLIRKVLPKHAKVTDESKETILECVTEFISFITGEANHHCKVERRKTVTAEDLIYAMGKVGFYEYAELLTIYLHRYRQHHEGANRVPHRMGSLPTLPTNAPMFPPSPSFVTGFPMMPPNPFSFPNPMSDGSSGGRFSSANVYYDPPVAYFNRDNYFRN
ncbi:Nuclear transcription factor Y subunit B-6 [Spatholobus suberectus]|nr:Nuclear transcription factor Y subunit B-6 [Spatholobus suberectus]